MASTPTNPRSIGRPVGPASSFVLPVREYLLVALIAAVIIGTVVLLGGKINDAFVLIEGQMP